MKHVLVLSFAAMVAAGLAGCGPLGSPGALQDGRFAYVCGSGVVDLGCTASVVDESDVPAAIAVGTHFDVQYNGSDEAIVAGLVPSAPSMLVADTPGEAGAFGFHFVSPGVVAILARTTDNGVADFLHVTGVPLDHVAITELGGASISTLTLALNGASTTVAAEPRGPRQQLLGGGMTYTWTVADPTVVGVQPVSELFGTPPGNEVGLAPLKAGTTTVTVNVNGQQATVSVTVQ